MDVLDRVGLGGEPVGDLRQGGRVVVLQDSQGAANLPVQVCFAGWKGASQGSEGLGESLLIEVGGVSVSGRRQLGLVLFGPQGEATGRVAFPDLSFHLRRHQTSHSQLNQADGPQADRRLVAFRGQKGRAPAEGRGWFSGQLGEPQGQRLPRSSGLFGKLGLLLLG
jgi:hypothetical protein